MSEGAKGKPAVPVNARSGTRGTRAQRDNATYEHGQKVVVCVCVCAKKGKEEVERARQDKMQQ